MVISQRAIQNFQNNMVLQNKASLRIELSPYRLMILWGESKKGSLFERVQNKTRPFISEIGIVFN